MPDQTGNRPFTFATATRIRFGRGEARAGVPEIAPQGASVLLVTGANGKRADWLAESLSARGCSVTRFAVTGEPAVGDIERGLTAARSQGADVIVGIGGGAALDTAKAIAALAPTTRPISDHLEVVGRGLPLELPPLRFVALPTTAGTGAEVTRNAVIQVPEARRKVSLRDPAMLPELAIVDPALTDNCPRAVTLASGLDAVTQVIEPYLCTRANPLTDALCRDAIPKGLCALHSLMERGESPADRDTMAWVSLCGGLALANAGLGVVHGLAGPLGGLTGAAHGAICGALLPHGLEANAGAVSDAETGRRIAQVRRWIAEALGGTPESAFDTLAAWSRDQGLPGLGALGMTKETRDMAASAAAASSSMKANPVAFTETQLGAILDRAR